MLYISLEGLLLTNSSEKRNQLMFHIILLCVTLCSVFPLALMIISSFTDEMSIVRNGYSLFPEQYSLAAYQYISTSLSRIWRAYQLTVFTTAFGVFVGVTIMALLAYPLARPDMPYRKAFVFIVFFVMLFNGGLVPTYILYSRFIVIKNTIWAQIFPNLLVVAYYVLMLRTFFANTVPFSIIESGQIEGANEFIIFIQLVVPISTPVLATVALFQTIAYWNSWFNGLIYITDSKLFTVQNILSRIQMDIQFLARNDTGSWGPATETLPSETVRMAIAVVAIIPILIIYPFFQRYFTKGLIIGAIKG